MPVLPFADKLSRFLNRPGTSPTGVAAMKRPSLLLKVAVVVSSLLLGVGFVGYRAGAFHWLTQPATPPADSQNNPTPAEKPSDDTPPTLIYGTKSSYVFQGRDTFDKPRLRLPLSPKNRLPPRRKKCLRPRRRKHLRSPHNARRPSWAGPSTRRCLSARRCRGRYRIR